MNRTFREGEHFSPEYLFVPRAKNHLGTNGHLPISEVVNTLDQIVWRSPREKFFSLPISNQGDRSVCQEGEPGDS